MAASLLQFAEAAAATVMLAASPRLLLRRPPSLVAMKMVDMIAPPAPIAAAHVFAPLSSLHTSMN